MKFIARIFWATLTVAVLGSFIQAITVRDKVSFVMTFLFLVVELIYAMAYLQTSLHRLRRDIEHLELRPVLNLQVNPGGDNSATLWDVICREALSAARSPETYQVDPFHRSVANTQKMCREHWMDPWSLREIEEERVKRIEWENLSEEEREERRATARIYGKCPRCSKKLYSADSDRGSEGACPMCHEFPLLVAAPMNHVWRERAWEASSESEKMTRIEAARLKIEANLSEWAAKGTDGIWRRKDNGAIVEMTEASLIESAKSHYGSEEAEIVEQGMIS